MSELDLTQTEADALIALPKVRVDETRYDFPPVGGRVSVPLRSYDGREEFSLDLSRGRIDLQKIKYQNRARHTIILIRLDVAGAPHTNPDGESVPCPHLHIFREGYGTKWAYPVPAQVFTNVLSNRTTLPQFMTYCNITVVPNINLGLFSS